MPLAAPTLLAVTSTAATAVYLIWTATPGADSYDVYRAKATGAGLWSAFAKINDAPVLAAAYTDNAANSTPDPAAGSTYNYYTVAVDGSGASQASNLAAATFAAPAVRVLGDMEADVRRIIAIDPMTEDAIFTHVGSAPRTIRGWFDNESSAFDTGAGEVRNSKPMWTGATADVEEAARKDSLQIQGITFYVQAVHPDGTGMTILELSKNGG